MNTTSITLHDNWKFHLGDREEAWFKDFDDSAWETVTVPHDWSVTLPFDQSYSSGTGYLAGGIGWYRVRFRLPEEYRGKRIVLCFDGIYKNSQVWCNSYYLGKRPNGYVPISYDITDRAVFGSEENELSVKVTHTDLADSRWFTGSGITRKVTVLIQEPVHPVQDGIFFSTLYGDADSEVQRQAQVEVSHELINESTHSVCLSLRTTLAAPGQSTVLVLTSQADFAAMEQKTIVLNGCVSNPLLWSVDTPDLYDLTTELSTDGSEWYTVFTQPVGIRTFRFDADQGFFLNGKSMKFKGVCLHHDGGCLGAAMYTPVWERRLLKLKEMGCNAVRTSHNPHMPQLYELCDRMGFLMIDEAFDEWENAKNKWSTGHNVYPPRHQGYFEDYPQWHDADLTAMVRRDRNHPSIVMWSIGNEIDYPNDPYCHPLFHEMTGNNDANKPSAERMYNPDRPNMERLAVIAADLASIVRRTDTTRAVTLAAAFPELSSRLHYFDSLDVVGYNYKEQYYEEDHKRFPSLPILGSENGHSFDAWKAVTDHPYISGQFLWTGIDYLGEAHGWPIHGSGAGHLTLAGYEKPDYHKRRAFWCDTPVIHMVTSRYGTTKSAAACIAPADTKEWMELSDSWNYTAGDIVLVRAYTNLSSAELFLNGKSLGICSEPNAFGCLEWLAAYEPGTLTVKGCCAASVAVHTLETAGAPAKLALTCFSPSILLDEYDAFVKQVEITVTDQNEHRITGQDMNITAQVSGCGTLLGLESGDLADCTAYTVVRQTVMNQADGCQCIVSSCSRRTYGGRLIAYVKHTGTDPLTLTLSGDGIETVSLTL